MEQHAIKKKEGAKRRCQNAAKKKELLEGTLEKSDKEKKKKKGGERMTRDGQSGGAPCHRGGKN